MAETFITLAIHTYDYAVALRDRLVASGIEVQLENVDICNPSPAPGVRVRIPESSLPEALRIVECDAEKGLSQVVESLDGVRDRILVPVDFSESAINAVKTAFAFAHVLKLKPEIMHVFATPYFDGSLSLTDNFTLDIRDTEVRKNLLDAAHEEMTRFRKRILALIGDGTLPPVKFSTTVREGLPEDVILDYTRSTPPQLVVMCTRSVKKKATQIMGSVTAEVLDACRVPVFTIPEDYNFQSSASLFPSVFFCNVDQHDLLAMDLFIRLFKTVTGKIFLIPVNEKAGSKLDGRINALRTYFAERYPGYEFICEIPQSRDLRALMRNLVDNHKISMLVVPNKKKNIFARLINPGIAHKVIFEADAPMLALPV